ncbi:MAG: carboxylating nicotinate-nucleotide diphosphorylase [Planctomycetes bacterium]|nr:carboxylating nicotinate-nucleotide diphosphorylase [Planctomycetota bacterium]
MKRGEAGDVIDAALAEDIGQGDVTGETLFAPGVKARGLLFSKAPGVLAGEWVAEEVFRRLDPRARVKTLATDGSVLRRGTKILEVRSTARALLAGERTALNFVQRLSGIATLAREFSRRARGTTVLDTRKTTPGMRGLEKWAVAMGGATNHRSGLYDAAMIKDNHLELLGKRADLGPPVKALHGKGVRVTVEAKSKSEAVAAIEAGADRVLLDNFTPAALAKLIPLLRRLAPKIEIEISGGVRLETIASFARLRPDFVSVGAITHSAPALDISMDIFPA